MSVPYLDIDTGEEDWLECEDCPELDEAVYILKDGEMVKAEVPDDTEDVVPC